MNRSEKLYAIALILKQASDKARIVGGNGLNGASRVNALAMQIDGIAMEFEIISRESGLPKAGSYEAL